MPVRGVFLSARPKFISAYTLGAAIGVAVALKDGVLDPLAGLLAIVGAAIAGALCNTCNTYFDYLNGIDARAKPTPFSAAGDVGGNPILRGLAAPSEVRNLALALSAVGLVLGAYFTLLRGWLMLVFIAHALVVAWTYSQFLSFKGLGELACLYFIGPANSLGAYFAACGMLSLEALLAGLPPGLQWAGVLWINEFPDIEADAASGRRTMVVRLGRRVASRWYVLIMASSYVVTAACVAAGLLPLLTLACLATVPLIAKASLVALKHYDDTDALIPAMALTMLAALFTQLIMSAAYLALAVL